MRREHLLRKIRKYNGGEVGGGYEGSFLTTADIDGDWREEVLTTAEGQLRIYSTDIPAMDRRPSLMQDRFYRMVVATASCGYHYDPMPEILPSTNSPDVVLTLKKPDLLQMSVTSPMHSALQGNWKLELPEGIQCSFTSEDIKLEKGSLWNKTVKLSGPGVGKCGKSYGIVRFLPTEAMGKGALDWTLFSPELVLDLPAGVQTVSMECISGALSLDAFSFIRCEEMEALKR